MDSSFLNKKDRSINMYNELGIFYYGHIYGNCNDNKKFINDILFYSKDKAISRLKMISSELNNQINKITILGVVSVGDHVEEKFLITEYKGK